MKKKRKKKNPRRGRSAAQRAATKRMLAAAKRARRSNPRRKKHHHHHAAKKRSNPGRRRRRKNPAPMIMSTRRRSRRRRRNPDMMRTVKSALKPVGLAALAAAIGLGGSFAIAKMNLTSATKVVAASLALGAIGGGAVSLIDPNAGLVTAMPFMVTAGQQVLAVINLKSSQSQQSANAASQNVAGLGNRLLAGRSIEGVTADDLAGTHRLLEGIQADDLAGIEADNLAGIYAEDF